MSYQSPTGGGRDKARVIAYALNKEFGVTQEDVRRNFKQENGKPVSQSTVSTWIKDVGHQVALNKLQRELAEARNEIKATKQLQATKLQATKLLKAD